MSRFIDREKLIEVLFEENRLEVKEIVTTELMRLYGIESDRVFVIYWIDRGPSCTDFIVEIKDNPLNEKQCDLFYESMRKQHGLSLCFRGCE